MPRLPKAQTKKRIAAIVCTYDRYDSLPGTLARLNAQSLPRSEYEVIVVDNSSDVDAQRKFWKRWQKRLEVNLEIEPLPGLSRARNVGVRSTKAPLVAFIDDDALPSPDWLKSLVAVFDEEKSAGAVGGP